MPITFGAAANTMPESKGNVKDVEWHQAPADILKANADKAAFTERLNALADSSLNVDNFATFIDENDGSDTLHEYFVATDSYGYLAKQLMLDAKAKEEIDSSLLEWQVATSLEKLQLELSLWGNYEVGMKLYNKAAPFLQSTDAAKKIVAQRQLVAAKKYIETASQSWGETGQKAQAMLTELDRLIADCGCGDAASTTPGKYKDKPDGCGCEWDDCLGVKPENPDAERQTLENIIVPELKGRLDRYSKNVWVVATAVRDILEYCQDYGEHIFTKRELKRINWKEIGPVIEEYLIAIDNVDEIAEKANNGGVLSDEEDRLLAIADGLTGKEVKQLFGASGTIGGQYKKVANLLNKAVDHVDAIRGLTTIKDAIHDNRSIVAVRNTQEYFSDGVITEDNLFAAIANYNYDDSIDDEDTWSVMGKQLYDIFCRHSNLKVTNGQIDHPREIIDGPRTAQTLEQLARTALTHTTNINTQTKIHEYLTTDNFKSLVDGEMIYTRDEFLRMLRDCGDYAIIDSFRNAAQQLNERGQASHLLLNQQQKQEMLTQGSYLSNPRIKRICDVKVGALAKKYDIERINVKESLASKMMWVVNVVTDTVFYSFGANPRQHLINLMEGLAAGAANATRDAKNLAKYNTQELKTKFGEYITSRVSPSIGIGVARPDPNGPLQEALHLGIQFDEKFGNDLQRWFTYAQEVANRKSFSAGVSLVNPFGPWPFSLVVNVGGEYAKQINQYQKSQLTHMKNVPVKRIGFSWWAALSVNTRSLLDSVADAHIGLFYERDHSAWVEQEAARFDTFFGQLFGIEKGVRQERITLPDSAYTSLSWLEAALQANAGWLSHYWLKIGHESLIQASIQEMVNKAKERWLYLPGVTPAQRKEWMRALMVAFIYGFHENNIEQQRYHELAKGWPKLTKIWLRFSLGSIRKWSVWAAMKAAKGKPVWAAIDMLTGALGTVFYAQFSTFSVSYKEDAKKTMSNYDKMNNGVGMYSLELWGEYFNGQMIANKLAEQLQVKDLLISYNPTAKTIKLSNLNVANINLRYSPLANQKFAYDATAGTLEIWSVDAISIMHAWDKDTRETYLILGGWGAKNTLELAGSDRIRTDSAGNRLPIGTLAETREVEQPLTKTQRLWLIGGITWPDAAVTAELQADMLWQLIDAAGNLVSPLPTRAADGTWESIRTWIISVTRNNAWWFSYTRAPNRRHPGRVDVIYQAQRAGSERDSIPAVTNLFTLAPTSRLEEVRGHIDALMAHRTTRKTMMELDRSHPTEFFKFLEFAINLESGDPHVYDADQYIGAATELRTMLGSWPEFATLRADIDAALIDPDGYLVLSRIVNAMKMIISTEKTLGTITYKQLFARRKKAFMNKEMVWPSWKRFPASVGALREQFAAGKTVDSHWWSAVDAPNRLAYIAWYRMKSLDKSKKHRWRGPWAEWMTRIAPGKDIALTGNAEKEWKKRFLENTQANNVHRQLLAKALTEKLATKRPEGINESQIVNLLDGKVITSADGEKQMKLKISWHFFLVAECGNESLGPNIDGALITEWKQYMSHVDPTTKKGHKLNLSVGNFEADYDIDANERKLLAGVQNTRKPWVAWNPPDDEFIHGSWWDETGTWGEWWSWWDETGAGSPGSGWWDETWAGSTGWNAWSWWDENNSGSSWRW